MGSNNPQWQISGSLSCKHPQHDGSYRAVTHKWKIFTPISLSLLHWPLWDGIQVGEPQLGQVKLGSLRAVSEGCMHNHRHSFVHKGFQWGLCPGTSLPKRTSPVATDPTEQQRHWVTNLFDGLLRQLGYSWPSSFLCTCHCYGGDLLCLSNALKLIHDCGFCHFELALFALT